MRPACRTACRWPARDARGRVWWMSSPPCPRSPPRSPSSDRGYENPRRTISSASVDRSAGRGTAAFVALVIGAAPFRGCCIGLDTLDQHAAVPGPVEHDDLTMLRQAFPEALQIVQRLLPTGGRGNRVHLEAVRIERPAQPAHHAALARGIPAFQHDDGAMRRAEVGLLHALQGFLHLGEAALVIGELHHREALDRRQPGTPGDDEVSGFHLVPTTAGLAPEPDRASIS